MVTRQESAHGLRRMGFGGTVAEIDVYKPYSKATFISNALVIRQTAPAAPAALADPNLAEWEKIQGVMKWWWDRIFDSSFTDTTKPSPIVERMTLFWHNHFATSADKVFNAKYMYDQNALFRANALGNFRTLCKSMAIQPAMLEYLDNASNTKTAPNQNFGRELLELFMLGVGNYTEADVLTCSYAWTGHNIEWLQDPVTGNWYPNGYKFFADRHDTTSRAFMGTTRVWDGPALIDFLLDNTTTRQIVAKYIAKKLWTWLVYPNPAQTIVDSLANSFIKAKWDIKSLLSALFNRAEFWTATAMNGAIRGPVEYMAAVGKATGARSDRLHPEWFSDAMGQTLLYPPNVSGWRPNEYWVNTSAATSRADFAGFMAWTVMDTTNGTNPNFLKDVVDDSLPPSQRPASATVVAKALEKFSIVTPSAETTSKLTAWCIANRHEWTSAEPWNYWGERVHLFQQILMCPDFQLN